MGSSLCRSKTRPAQQLSTRVGYSTPETSGNEECTPETTELVNTWLDGITLLSEAVGSSSEESVTQARPKGLVGDGMLDQAQPDRSAERETRPRMENDVEASRGSQGLERRQGGQETGRGVEARESGRVQVKDYLSKDSHYSGGTGGTSGTDRWGSSEQTQDFQTLAPNDHSTSKGQAEHGAGGLERQVSSLQHGAERTPAGVDDRILAGIDDRTLGQDAKSTNGATSKSSTSSDERRYAAAVREDHLTLQDWVTFAVDQQESQEGAD